MAIKMSVGDQTLQELVQGTAPSYAWIASLQTDDDVYPLCAPVQDLSGKMVNGLACYQDESQLTQHTVTKPKGYENARLVISRLEWQDIWDFASSLARAGSSIKALTYFSLEKNKCEVFWVA